MKGWWAIHATVSQHLVDNEDFVARGLSIQAIRPLTCIFQQVPAVHTEFTDMQACASHPVWKDAAL
jgi:hypothetical protein